MTERAMSGDPVPELASAYQRARVQVVVAGALLLLWRAGIAFEGPLPALGVRITAGEKLPYLLGAVLLYAVARLIIEWFQSHPARRRRLVSRIDLLITLAIAGTAFWFARSTLLPLTSLPPPWIIVPALALVVLGIFAGATGATVVHSLFFIRSKREASRLALPRRPVAVRAAFRTAYFAFLSVGLTLLLAPGFASPLAYLWLWLLGVPAGLVFFSESISILVPWRKRPDGSTGTRAEYVKRLRRAFDMHDTSYQQGGWDKPIPPNNSPLYEAAELGDAERVRQLFDQRADPNERNMHGWTALMIAVANMHVEIARLLLQRGADPNLGNFLGRNPIMFAARYGRADLVRDLIEFGADANVKAWPDPGPLAVAAQFGHREVVELLLAAGADPLHCDRQGLTAIDLAQAGGHGEIAAILRKAARPAAAQPGV